MDNLPITLNIDFENLNLSGDDIQKLSVIQNLPQLLETESSQTLTRIIPKIIQELPNASSEFHVLTSKAFRLLMEKQAPPNLFHSVLQGIDLRDTIAANAWMETLIAVIPILNTSQIRTEVIPLVGSKSLISQPVLSRIASCKILGRIAIHSSLEPTDVKRDVLPLAQSLCQDCHPEVRTVMCSQLPYVAQGLGANLVKGSLLASLVEMGSDDNMYVRAASVSSIVQIFPYSTLEVKKGTLLPLLKQLCEKCLKKDELTAATLSKELGKILEGLQYTLNTPEALWFLNFYKKLAFKGLMKENEEFIIADVNMDVTCRQQAAANLPAMSTFTFAILPTQIEILYTIFTGLVADPCYMVRKTVAGCLCDVVKIFNTNSKLLRPDFVRLLQDDAEEVLHALIQQVGTTLELFCQFGTLSQQIAGPTTLEIGRAMLKCQYEIASGNNWRLLMHFIYQLEHLPNCMPPDFIHQHFTPIILACAVQGRARPVRVQAVRTLLIFLRYNGKEMQRRWLRENLVQQLCHSDSYYTRLIYVRLCTNAFDLFSDKYFKEYFFEHLLDLADDPIPNIRLCVANLFTFLKQMIILPEDKLLYERLNEIMMKYANEEKDRDVMNIFQIKMKEMKTTNVDKEEYKREQKRRREEEDKINSGVKPLVVVASVRKSITPVSTTNTRNETARSDFSSNTKKSLPMKQPITAQSDMTILEQHFYIDAGINLPDKSLSTESNTLTIHPKNLHTTKLETWTNNITDDDKVNLRKLPQNHRHNNANKRHSSIISETCIKKSQEKAHNRRSLNLPTKTISRIPISNKSTQSSMSSKSITNEISTFKSLPVKTSQLPVLIRHSMDSRK